MPLYIADSGGRVGGVDFPSEFDGRDFSVKTGIFFTFIEIEECDR
jgi:hypothetical protein